VTEATEPTVTPAPVATTKPAASVEEQPAPAPSARPGQPTVDGGWDESLPSIPAAPADQPTPENRIYTVAPVDPPVADLSLAITPIEP